MPRIRLTERDVREFMDSPVWEDLKGLLERRLALVENDLRTKDGVPLYRAQGEALTLDFLQAYPEMTLSALAKQETEEETRHAENREL